MARHPGAPATVIPAKAGTQARDAWALPRAPHNITVIPAKAGIHLDVAVAQPAVTVIPAKAGIQAVTPSVVSRHSKEELKAIVLPHEQHRSAVLHWRFEIVPSLPLTPTPLPVGEGPKPSHPGEGRDPGPQRTDIPDAVTHITVIPAKAGTHLDVAAAFAPGTEANLARKQNGFQLSLE